MHGKLSEIAAYAATCEEYPDADTDTWQDPSYLNFLKTQRNKKIFTIQDFKEAMQHELAARGEPHLFEIVGRLTPSEGAFHYVIWSDLHGAFHSLVRALLDLQKHGIISDDLKIIPDNYCFVFNGDVFDESPYLIETTTLVLMLMARNRDKVFHLVGYAEDKNRWKDRGLGRQLRHFLQAGDRQQIPLEHETSSYCVGLPHALYIKDPVSNMVARIAPHEFSAEGPMEGFLGDFFDELSDAQYRPYSFARYLPTRNKPKLVAAVQGADVWDGSKETQPLTHRLLQDQSLLWILRSSQVRTYRQLYRFFYDAYAVVTVPSSLADATITVHAHDVRTPTAPFTESCYRLVTAAPCSADAKAVVSL